ncbi:Xylulose 5-phosphate/Fructose 6-phosphate phosphoketolase N-terminal [Penicillium viridicatum]|nr:Xylulose 5-phosphate/Fructose 6-phosphate phosphoketolase N-terminal [Penicillium viridicatum]
MAGVYSEVYPDEGEDMEGMKKFFKQFSFPSGTGSHATPETPGSIHEGVGDGKSETGLQPAGTARSFLVLKSFSETDLKWGPQLEALAKGLCVQVQDV